MITPSHLPHVNRRVTPPRQAAALAPLPRRHIDPAADIAIRMAGANDAPALGELEQLDGRSLPIGRRLLAELGGVPVAAIAVADDTVVADPFARTGAVVDLLRVRARQLRLSA
ncbi:MAG: hypothetical protein ACJ762_08895 [Solirubrobacteraceae bacterium]